MSLQVDTLRRAVAGRARTSWKPSATPVIVVAGAHGGAGTSTVAALVASALAMGGRRTLLVDTDENVGAQHRILNAPVQQGIAALLSPDVSFDAVALEVAAQCVLIPGGEAPDARRVPFDPGARRTVMRRLAQSYGAFDAVIIDAGARLDGILAAAEPAVRRVLIVASATPAAIAASYAVLKTVESRWDGIVADVLFNRVTPELGRAAYEQVHHGAQHFLNRSLGFAGVLPDDAALATAPDLPLHRCTRDTETAVQQLATALIADADVVAHP